MEIETDIIRQVYDEDGNFIQIRPFPDAPQVPCIMTVKGAASEDYFGRIYVSFSPKFAIAVGKALIACAMELENKS